MTRSLLQQALDALENPALPAYTTLRKQIRMALAAPMPEPVAYIVSINTDAGPTSFFTAPDDPRGFPVYTAPPAAPMPEPVAWYLPSPDGDDSIFRDHRTVIACTGNKWEGFLPLYAAPPAAPAPAVCDGGTCGLGGYCVNCPKQIAAPVVPLSCDKVPPGNGYCDYCARGEYEKCRYTTPAAPVVPLTDEQFADMVAEASLAVDLAANPIKLLAFARAVLSAAPVVREPLTREQQIAIREAHCNTASDEYFGARPQVDDATKRRVYEAGFKEGWESGIGGGNG